MKRSTLKLEVRRETLRVLAELELIRVAGGNLAAVAVDTGNAGTGCPNARVAIDTGGAATGCPNV